MFLSQLEINPRSRDAQRDLADPYQMHRTLCRAFGSKAELEAARLLYRVDVLQNGATVVLVQTKTAPDWSTLPSNYCLEAPPTKEWQPRLSDDQTLSFRLRANPTVCKDGKRRGLYDEHAQLMWLARKAEACGFSLPQEEVEIEGKLVRRPAVQVVPEGETMTEKRENGCAVQFRRVDTIAGQHAKETGKATGETKRALFSAARFDGILQVTDSNKLKETLENGIGPAKAFGFGLLSLRRA